MDISLESLGLTKEELQDRVIDVIADQMLRRVVSEPGRETEVESTRFKKHLEQKITKRIDDAVQALADKYVIPNATQYLEKLLIRETNVYGEQKKAPKTFIEYLVWRAEGYLTEQVDDMGRSKAERNDYSWRGTSTRLTFLVHRHLDSNIKQAMEAAVKNANEVIVDGLEKTVKLKLAEIQNALKVSVSTGR